MRSLFKSVAGAFVEFDEAANSTPAPTAVSVTATPSGQPSKVVKTIMDACMARQTDYTRFMEAVEKLASIIPDEITRMKAALVSANGRQVVLAIDIHMHEIGAQREQFRRTLEEQRGKAADVLADAGTKERQIEARKESIARMRREIEETERTIRNEEAEVSRLKTEAAAADQTIKTIEGEFNTAVATVERTFTERKALINSLIT